MSIYLNKDSKIIVQGMTGGMGSKHTTLMLDAGSNIVGGVNARKAGEKVDFDTATGPNAGTTTFTQSICTRPSFRMVAAISRCPVWGGRGRSNPCAASPARRASDKFN